MRQAIAFAIHLAHVALLLIALLNDWRARRPTRPDVHRAVRERLVVPQYSTHDRIEIEADVARLPQCPMLLWQPDRSVSYAAVVISVDTPAQSVGRHGATPCINPYGRPAAYP